MFVLFFGMTYSFPQNVYINPGIKLGYMFGEKGGFVLGVELSVTKEFPNNYKLWGLVIDFDESKSLDKIHLGLESSMYVVGIDAGPTFAWDNEGNYLGFSLIPFSGAILIPYYEFTFLNKDKLFSEIGSYIKVTIPNKNNSFSFGPE